ncbi:TPA: RDD family protein, partial [Enterococcus faecium]|nr:RDD family protein [Enterococcus faecium]
MSELSNENKEQEKDKQQQPAVGPDSNFSQKVLSSFEREPLTPEEIKKKQRKWKKYTDTRNEPPKANDFPKYFYAGFFIRMFAFLVDLLCIGAITRLTLGIAKNLGWLNFSDSYLSIYGFTALLIYLAYFILLTKF